MNSVALIFCFRFCCCVIVLCLCYFVLFELWRCGGLCVGLLVFVVSCYLDSLFVLAMLLC